MGRIYYLLGKSATGKDTLYKEILKRRPKLRTVTMYTTRPIREGETDGVEYFFTDREELERQLRNYQGSRLLVMGPAPARVVRVMNRYRYQLTLLGKNTRLLRNILSGLMIRFKKDNANKTITVTVDVNPMD